MKGGEPIRGADFSVGQTSSSQIDIGVIKLRFMSGKRLL